MVISGSSIQAKDDCASVDRVGIGPFGRSLRVGVTTSGDVTGERADDDDDGVFC